MVCALHLRSAKYFYKTDRTLNLPSLTRGNEQIQVVENSVYLGSCISAGGGVSDEINVPIVKARAAYNNLSHLERTRDAILAVKGRIYNVSWQHHVSNAQVRHHVFGYSGDNSSGITILKHLLQWVGNSPQMSSQRIPRQTLFADAGTGWKKRGGGQYMTRCHCMKESYTGIASVGPSRLPGRGPRDGATQWLDTNSDMIKTLGCQKIFEKVNPSDVNLELTEISEGFGFPFRTYS
ncbi:unnamed protein product [Schistosoma margrebowiei]|uniref:Uncharacterized protein n=1 Tax=Schistosoma margrebowiei TaxID=48269 RepID=A0A183LIQ3_9TREM|nr:unnamed protein product [Schistosoma margrebowiei]